jgi:hypothetical protein
MINRYIARSNDYRWRAIECRFERVGVGEVRRPARLELLSENRLEDSEDFPNPGLADVGPYTGHVNHRRHG